MPYIYCMLIKPGIALVMFSRQIYEWFIMSRLLQSGCAQEPFHDASWNMQVRGLKRISAEGWGGIDISTVVLDDLMDMRAFFCAVNLCSQVQNFNLLLNVVLGNWNFEFLTSTFHFSHHSKTPICCCELDCGNVNGEEWAPHGHKTWQVGFCQHPTPIFWVCEYFHINKASQNCSETNIIVCSNYLMIISKNWNLRLLMTRIDSYWHGYLTCNPEELPSWSSEPALDDGHECWYHRQMIHQAIIYSQPWSSTQIWNPPGLWETNLWHISSKLPKIWELPAQVPRISRTGSEWGSRLVRVSALKLYLIVH